MYRPILILLLFILSNNLTLLAQKHDYTWLFGYKGNVGPFKPRTVRADALEVFPNPTSGFVNVRIPAGPGITAELIVANTLGQVQFRIPLPQDVYQIQIPILALPDGSYTIHINAEKTGIVQQAKFFVKH